MHRAKGGWIVPFQQADGRGTAQKQHQRGQQNQLGIDAEFTEGTFLGDLLPDQKAKAADDHQCAEGQQHDGVGLELHKAGAGGNAAEDIKSGIAECGDGVENTPAESFPEAVFRPEPQSQDQRAHALHRKTAGEHRLLQADNTVHIV